MKQLICFFICLLTMTSAYATGVPICSVTKTGGGKHGYRNVSWQQQFNTATQEMCWVGECDSPGREACRPPHNGGGSANLDSTDYTAIEELLKKQDDAWHNGELDGMGYLTILVEGEQSNRYYRVEWSTGPHKEVIVEIYRD
ncbi:MAG: hypothetical protein ACK500_11995 [Flavobacteriales bacterium]|jgi:hypothetical protein